MKVSPGLEHPYHDLVPGEHGGDPKFYLRVIEHQEFAARWCYKAPLDHLSFGGIRIRQCMKRYIKTGQPPCLRPIDLQLGIDTPVLTNHRNDALGITGAKYIKTPKFQDVLDHRM